MRALTSDQAKIYGLTQRASHVRVKVDRGGGSYIDLSNYEGHNWIDGVSYYETVDSPGLVAEVRLRRKAEYLNLSPLVDGSKLNQGGTLIDVGSSIIIEACVIGQDVGEPQSSDWLEVFNGFIDDIDWESSPMMLACRDKHGFLSDTFIETQRVYGSGSGQAVEQIMQDVLDNDNPAVVTVTQNLSWNGTTTVTTADTSGAVVGDFIGFSVAPYFKITAISVNTSFTITNPSSRTIPSGSGASASVKIPAASRITLYSVTGNSTTPFQSADAPGFSVKPYVQSKQSILEALKTLALQFGWDCRYRWHSNTTAFQLVLSAPDRAIATTQHTFSRYFQPRKLKITRKDVRNVVRVVYTDPSNNSRNSVTVTDSASIAKYGRRMMEIAEAGSSQIDSNSEATTMANAALSDLKDPKADWSVPVPYFLNAEIGDYYKFPANGDHFDADQDLAVIGIRHDISQGSARTLLDCRGKPSGGRLRWLRIEGRPGVNPSIDLRSDAAATGIVTLPLIGGLTVTYDDPRTMSPPVKDWAYTECHVGTSSGFTPTAGTLKAKGKTTRFTIGDLTPNLTYYVKLIIYDEAGNIATTSAQAVQATALSGPYHANFDTQNGNIVPNGDFEVTSIPHLQTTHPPDTWKAWNLTSGVQDDALWNTSDGVYSALNSISQSGKTNIELRKHASKNTAVLSEFFPVQASQLYLFEYVLRADDANVSFLTLLEFFSRDKGTENGSYAVVGTLPVAAGNWFRQQIVRVTENDEFWCRVVIGRDKGTGAAGSKGFIDRVQGFKAMPSFHVHQSTNQSVTQTTSVKMNLQTELFDFGSNFDSSTNYQFTAPEDGVYSFSGGVGIDALPAGKLVQASIFVNGTIAKEGTTSPAWGATTYTVATVAIDAIELAQGDTVDLRAYHNDAGALNSKAVANTTYFMGKKVR